MSQMQSLRKDFTASIVVFLVAIPLCLGIALASGAPAFAGILTGIIGGIVVGALSDSKVSVSGPAAGMIAVVLAAIAALGSYQAFLLAVLLAGILQIIIGAFRAGFIADYIPSNVITGLIAAIGIVIIIKQLPFAFGYFNQTETLQESLKVASQSLTMTPITHLLTHISIGATIITLISFAILILWNRMAGKFAKIFPAAVVVVVAAIVINKLFDLAIPALALNTSHLVNIPVNDSFTSLVASFQHPSIADFSNPKVYLYAVIIAIIASLETLLNLEAAEKMDKTHRYSSRNKELIAQGVGNTLSGLLGGLPITSVIVRSTVNIHAGARSKMSTIFHGLLLLLSLALIPEWLNQIPIAALAAILIYTGYKLAHISLFKKMYAQGFSHFFPFIVTVVAIVTTNLLLGILIGLATSFFFILRNNSKNKPTTIKEIHHSGNATRIILPQQVTFLSKASIIATLKNIPKNSKATIDANSTDYIDNDIIEVIQEFKHSQAEQKNIVLNLEGFEDHYDIGNQTNFLHFTNYDVQSRLSAQEILTILQEGNQRFINNTPIHKNIPKQIQVTSTAQHPIAVMLGCIDSRVPVEMIFDVSVGDIFVTRVAGNVINNDILASMEYACEVAGAKLIVILGHTECGAIKSACDNVKVGHITELLDKIQPAIDTVKKVTSDHNSKNADYVAKVTLANIENTKQLVYQQSDILRKLIDDESIALIGAVYDVNTGIVQFEQHDRLTSVDLEASKPALDTEQHQGAQFIQQQPSES